VPGQISKKIRQDPAIEKVRRLKEYGSGYSPQMTYIKFKFKVDIGLKHGLYILNGL